MDNRDIHVPPLLFIPGAAFNNIFNITILASECDNILSGQRIGKIDSSINIPRTSLNKYFFTGSQNDLTQDWFNS